MILLQAKYFIPFFSFLVLTTSFTCKKDNDPNNGIVNNCDGLVTDTSGTNELAYVKIGNAFTPNGDKINDSYSPVFRNIASFDFTILDANNTTVFTTSEFGKAWVPATQYANNSIFYFRIQAITKENHHIGACGDVHLLTCLPHNTTGDFYFTDQLDPNGTFSLPTADKISECP